MQLDGQNYSSKHDLDILGHFAFSSTCWWWLALAPYFSADPLVVSSSRNGTWFSELVRYDGVGQSTINAPPQGPSEDMMRHFQGTAGLPSWHRLHYPWCRWNNGGNWGSWEKRPLKNGESSSRWSFYEMKQEKQEILLWWMGPLSFKVTLFGRSWNDRAGRWPMASNCLA